MAASQSLTVPEIPADISIEDFTKRICDLKLPCLINYAGTITDQQVSEFSITGQQVSEFLQQKFNEKSITITLQNVFGTTYCVKGSIDETHLSPDNVQLPTTSCIIKDRYSENSLGYEVHNNGLTRIGEHVFNDYWYIPPVPLTKTTSNLVEKYILLIKKANDVYVPCNGRLKFGGEFYPTLDQLTTSVKLIDANEEIDALKIKFDPKTDFIYVKWPTSASGNPKTDLILPSQDKVKQIKNDNVLSCMSSCLDGHIEKFLILDKCADEYYINDRAFYTKETVQEILTNPRSDTTTYLLKIMFQTKDIITIKTKKKDPQTVFHLHATEF